MTTTPKARKTLRQQIEEAEAQASYLEAKAAEFTRRANVAREKAARLRAEATEAAS